METYSITEKERIEKIMESEGMKSSQFAEEIGIKTPTLSHILSGRNNPSLDVMQRVLTRFKNINSDWLILGQGEMYSEILESNELSLFDINDNIQSEKTSTPIVNKEVNEIKDNQTNNQQIVQNIVEQKQKNIIKIIVYYDDNSFEEFRTSKIE